MKRHSNYKNILNVCIVTFILTLSIAFIPIITTNSNQTDHCNTNISNTPSISSNTTSALSAPQNLSYITLSNSIILSWDPISSNGSSGITQYLIYRGTSSGQESYLTEVDPGTLSYTDTAVTNGTTYYYEVAANNSAGIGPFSNEICAILNNTTGTPSAPQYLNYTIYIDSIILTWSPPSSNGSSAITQYLIYKGTSSGQESYLAAVGSSTLNYSDSDVGIGVTYCYEVAAKNSAGIGSFSNEISVVFNNGAPTPPQNLSYTTGSNGIILSWDPPAFNGSNALIGYVIDRTTNPSQYLYLTEVGPDTLSYTDTAVTNGQQYYYQVVAITNNQSCYYYSKAISVIYNNVPSAPQNLSYTTGSNSIILSWDPPSSNGSSGITQYLIYRGTSSGQESYLTEESPGTLSYTDTAVTNGTTYYYEVVANNSAGIGSSSNEINVIFNNNSTNNNTTNAIPSAPQNLNYTTEYDKIILSWDPPSSNGSSAITNYIIYRGTNSGNETLLSTVDNVLIYNDSNVINGQEYYYKVAAANSAGIGPFSNEICAIINNTTMNNVPSAPLNLHAIVNGYKVILTWDPPSSNGSSPITSYNIYCSNSSGNEVYLLTINSTQTYYTYNFTTINSSEEIFYLRVSANNKVGEGPLSNECNVTLQNNPLLNLSSIGGISLGELISMGLIGTIAVVALVKKKIFYSN